MTTITQNYVRLERAINDELPRLRSEGHNYKAEQIVSAVGRLYFAVVQQCPEFRATPSIYTYGEGVHVEDMQRADLSSLNAMLDCNIREWDPGTADYYEQGARVDGRPAAYAYLLTVRESLDIAPYNVFNVLNVFNIYGPTWGSTFGRTPTLTNVIKKLGLE